MLQNDIHLLWLKIVRRCTRTTCNTSDYAANYICPHISIIQCLFIENIFLRVPPHTRLVKLFVRIVVCKCTTRYGVYNCLYFNTMIDCGRFSGGNLIAPSPLRARRWSRWIIIKRLYMYINYKNNTNATTDIVIARNWNVRNISWKFWRKNGGRSKRIVKKLLLHVYQIYNTTKDCKK